ncbi:hypothetical protein AQUCO_00900887v1 [Aquilegia coerulea]|uniref:Poly(A) RNA polymerase mitochondrial-like central palm domain-containing protein n=1 Tax=Aquilegia coerulea TaxID=218851 RepID=A0A2G5EFV9_AQUCA|nr:hypothetical protein AQUCO_00900887v1 [Aquilegia coerulea]
MSYGVTRILSYEQLGLAISDILFWIKPSSKDHEARQAILKALQHTLRLMGYKDAKVEPFGSFLYNLYTKNADLDISVDIPSSIDSSANVLGHIRRILLQRNLPILNFVPEARIPLLTFQSIHWNVTCDVTIKNHLGEIKSKFLLWISKIDKRFGDMVLLVKEWAKANDINNPKEGTFNSYALCLLVIFHLQTCMPAILPPLKEIYAGTINVNSSTKLTEERRIQHVCATNIEKFLSRRAVNRSTLPQLVVSFFEKFSQFNVMAGNHVISTYSGKWEDKRNCRWMAQKTDKIEDPLQLSDNTARTVRKRHLTKISQAFGNTYNSFWHVSPSRSYYHSCLR